MLKKDGFTKLSRRFYAALTLFQRQFSVKEYNIGIGRTAHRQTVT